MKSSSVAEKPNAVPEFLSGGGEMGQRIREYDWSTTPLGPVDTWPQSLRTCIRIMLTSRQPIWIGWGRQELVKFYNDPYKAIVGGKHPWALGTAVSIVWKDIWRDIEPMLKQVMEKDEGTYVESQLLIMERNGYPEETYYTFSYTPIPGDDGKTEGVFCANTDDTDKIISERQLKTLTQLGKALADCQNNREIIERTIATLQENPQDFPFAIFRTIVDNKAVFTHSTPLGNAEGLIAQEYDLSEQNEVTDIIKRTLVSGSSDVFHELLKKVGELPKGAWEISPDKLIVLPITGASKEPYGTLSVGLNPYRLLDENYLSFFNLITDQIATSFADVHVLEEERKRAEALAEIDRAKTTFFSNISHEFRTPLTLLLGPIEDALHDPNTVPENRTRMEVAYRNALRMQKLVNTLLEFSRIEAGRVEGKYTRVDICTLTQELSSTFRSAIEKAGMQLVFDCSGIKDEVYVDVDMWEKIVLNLVSNAFKYSKQGSITISVKQVGDEVKLSVADTGIGIPEEHLDKIFDRFHRIDTVQGRSQEGTGIGLAMVKELVRLHHGKISVESEVGKGSVFTVTILVGKDHLPDNKIVEATTSTSNYSKAFVQEVMKWSGEDGDSLGIVDDMAAEGRPHDPAKKKYKVVLADDNSDMRSYVKRLLSEHFEVIAAVDGEDAFAKIADVRPDLLLSDIMMPKLDGFGLLQKIRSHPDLATLPVILLSARAGEEAKVEGLEAGADDYLVKPFSAKELLARVDSNIKIAKNRIANEANLREMVRQSPVATVLLRGRSMIIEIVNEKGLELWGRKYEDVINQPIAEALPEIAEQGFVKLLEQVYDTGIPFNGNEIPAELVRFGKPEIVFLNFIYQPLKNESGETTGIIGAAIDITEQVLARKKIEESQNELDQLANAVPQLVWVSRPDGEVVYYNDRVSEFEGARKTENGNWVWTGLVHPKDLAATQKAWSDAVNTGEIYQIEHRIRRRDGNYRWFLSRAIPYKDENGTIMKWFGTATDIHTSKEQATILEEEIKRRTRELNESNLALQQSNHELQQFAHVASHDLREPVRKIKTFTSRLIDDRDSSFSDQGMMYLKKVNSAADRMNIMIEGVLNYSMLSAAHQRIEKVDLNKTIADIQSDLELLITRKSATIRHDRLPVIEGASVLLYQLFYNLVNNSLKFSQPSELPVVDIYSSIVRENGRDFAEISINDNGIGFEQEFADKIFETFLRLNSKDQFEGTGLGLSLCKRITERHGGSINAFGEPEKGSRFVIRLPLQQERKNI